MQRTDKVWWCVAALSGVLMVMLGAYAAHGMQARTTEAMVSAVETGVRYQAWHTLAMMIVLVWKRVQPLSGQRWILACWALGVVGFSGSLYVMALAGLSVGIVTPIGGMLLMLGWVMLAITVVKAS